MRPRSWLFLLAGLALLPAVAGEARVVRIFAERFVFVPSVIKVRAGETVEMRIRSDDTNHGFRIARANINIVIPKRGRGEAKVLFRAEAPGEYPFECSKACGAGHTMMRGMIVVERRR